MSNKTTEEILLETKQVELKMLELQDKREATKLSNNAKLTEKLNNIATDIISLQKDAGKTKGNAGISYDYLTGDKIYTNIKPLMKKYGVDIDPAVVPGTFKVELMEYIHTKKGWSGKPDVVTNKREYQVSGILEYTISDTKTGFSFKSQWPFVGTQYDDPAKAYGTALTYADKYFFIKRFHIGTDKDDADAKINQLHKENENKGNENKGNENKGNENKGNEGGNGESKPAFSLESKDLIPMLKAYAEQNQMGPGPSTTKEFYNFIYKETNTPPASGLKPTEIITSQEQLDGIRKKLDMKQELKG